MCGKNLPPTRRLRDSAHAQWLQTHCQWYLSRFVGNWRCTEWTCPCMKGLACCLDSTCDGV